MEGCVNSMASRISTNRQKYKGMEKATVVPLVHQILHKRWQESASMTVIELEEGEGEFMVSEQYSNDHNEANNQLEQNDTSTQDTASTALRSVVLHAECRNIVKPQQNHCTCGKWQEHCYPCRHGIAYFRYWEERDFQ